MIQNFKNRAQIALYMVISVVLAGATIIFLSSLDWGGIVLSTLLVITGVIIIGAPTFMFMNWADGLTIWGTERSGQKGNKVSSESASD